MARTKGAKNKAAVKKHVFKDPSVEEIIEEWIEFNCPIRGKVRQKVKVKRLKKVTTETKAFVGAQSIIDDIEKEEDDISSIDIDPEE